MIQPPKSPPCMPVHSTKVAMHISRMLAIQNLRFFWKVRNGWKAMTGPRVRSPRRSPPPSAGLDTARNGVVWVREEAEPNIAIVASLRESTTPTRGAVCGHHTEEEKPGHRRVARQGANDQQIPRPRVRGRRLQGPRP